MDTHRNKAARGRLRSADTAAPKALAESSERVDLRIAPEDKLLIERAADMQGETISGFMKSVAMREARAVIDGATMTQLSLRDQQRFVEVVLGDSKPAPALVAAATRYKRRIVSK